MSVDKSVEEQMKEMTERLNDKFKNDIPICFSFVINDANNNYGTALATIDAEKSDVSVEQARHQINDPESNIPNLVLRMFNTALESYMAKTLDEENENESTV